MPGRRMSRPTYRQPNGAIRTDAYRHSDSAIELDYYHRQLERVHGSGLHGWGVADGLRVTATQNSPNLKIEPGVAIDKDGQHISLAEGGTAEIGWHPDVPGTAPMPAAVNADGAVFPTAGLSGDFYV